VSENATAGIIMLVAVCASSFYAGWAIKGRVDRDEARPIINLMAPATDMGAYYCGSHNCDLSARAGIVDVLCGAGTPYEGRAAVPGKIAGTWVCNDRDAAP
jgi:hypothetical protein